MPVAVSSCSLKQRRRKVLHRQEDSEEQCFIFQKKKPKLSPPPTSSPAWTETSVDGEKKYEAAADTLHSSIRSSSLLMLQQPHVMMKIASATMPLQLISMELLNQSWQEISLLVRHEKKSLAIMPVLYNDPAILKEFGITSTDCIGESLWSKIYHPNDGYFPVNFTEDPVKLSQLLSKYPNLRSIALTCLSDDSLLIIDEKCKRIQKLAFLYPCSSADFAKHTSFIRCHNLTRNVTEIAIGDRNDDQFIDRICSSFPNLRTLIFTSLHQHHESSSNLPALPIQFREAFANIHSNIKNLHLRSRPVSFDQGICGLNPHLDHLTSLDVMNIVSRVDIFVSSYLPRLKLLQHLAFSMIGDQAHVINRYSEEINLRDKCPLLQSLCIALEDRLPDGFIGHRPNLHVLKLIGKGQRTYMFNEFDVEELPECLPNLKRLCISPIKLSHEFAMQETRGYDVFAKFASLREVHMNITPDNMDSLCQSISSGSKISRVRFVPIASNGEDDRVMTRINKRKIHAILSHEKRKTVLSSSSSSPSSAIQISFQENTHDDYLQCFNTCLCPYETLISRAS